MTTQFLSIHRFLNKFAILGFGIAMAGLSSQPVRADETWVGDTSQDWNTAANWSSDPGNPTGNFFINTATAGVYPVLSANSSFTPVDVIIANGGTNTARLDQRAGNLSLQDTSANGNWFFVARGANTANATYNLANTSVSDPGISGYDQGSGSLTVGKFFVGGGYYNGGGNGTVNINTTGSLTANSTQNSGGNASIALGIGSGSSGTINLQSGTITTAGDLWVSTEGTGAVNQTGGTVNVGAWFVGSRWNGSSGTYNQSGGTVNVTSNAVGVSYGGGTGAINVSGGTFNCNDVWVSECYGGTAGTGTLTISGTGTVNPTWWVWITKNAAATGVVNLDGGTLATAHITKGDGSATFNFNGGTLKAKRDDTNFIEGAVSVNVKSGGAVVDTNGYAVTIQNVLAADAGSPGGGLTKNGAGTLTLSGANTYAGGTSINAGTLSVGNVIDNGNLGASTSGVALNGGTLRLTHSAVADGTFGSRVLAVGASGGTLNVNGTATTGQNSRVIFNTANTLAGNGALTITGRGTLDGWGGGRGAVVNTASQSYGGAITLQDGGLLAIEGGGLASGATISIGNNAEFSIGTGVTVNNNVTVTGGTTSNMSWTNGGTGVLAGNLILNANLRMSMRNWYSSKAQSGTVSGVVSGTGTLTILDGPGTLTLTGANTYTGATTISAGTLQLGNGGAAGSLSTSSAISIASGANLRFNQSDAVTQGTDFSTAAITGEGAVTQAGSGTLTLNTANTYTGGTTIGANQNAAVLRATASGALGTGTIGLDSVGNASTARLELEGGITLSNAISFPARGNTSTGIKNTGGANTLTGDIALGTGGNFYTIESDSGLLTLSGNLTPPISSTRTIVLNGGADGVLSGSVNFTSGNILGVTKDGTGTWTLSGTNTYTGDTTIHAGTLALGTGGSIANSGKIIVGDAGSSGTVLDATALSGLGIGASQTLSGIGTVNVGSGNTLTVSGTLAPGNSIGTLIINGDAVLAGTAEFEINPDPNPVLADLADVSGNLTYGGTLNVTNIGGALQWGNTFNLFDWGTLSDSYFSAVTLPSLSPGLVWQNNLLVDGTITVVPEPATTLGLSLLLFGALLRRRRRS